MSVGLGSLVGLSGGLGQYGISNSSLQSQQLQNTYSQYQTTTLPNSLPWQMVGALQSNGPQLLAANYNPYQINIVWQNPPTSAEEQFVRDYISKPDKLAILQSWNLESLASDIAKEIIHPSVDRALDVIADKLDSLGYDETITVGELKDIVKAERVLRKLQE